MFDSQAIELIAQAKIIAPKILSWVVEARYEWCQCHGGKPGGYTLIGWAEYAHSPPPLFRFTSDSLEGLLQQLRDRLEGK